MHLGEGVDAVTSFDVVSGHRSGILPYGTQDLEELAVGACSLPKACKASMTMSSWPVEVMYATEEAMAQAASLRLLRSSLRPRRGASFQQALTILTGPRDAARFSQEGSV